MLEHKTVSMCVNSDYCRGWNDAVAEMPRWISVEERLPDRGKLVLVFCKIREGSYAYAIRAVGCFCGLCPYSKGGNSVPLWSLHGIDLPQSRVSVTHWMLLPDAPEVDDE